MVERFYQVKGVNFKRDHHYYEEGKLVVEDDEILEVFKSRVAAEASLSRGFGDNFLDFDVLKIEPVDLEARLPLIADMAQGNQLRIYGHRLHLSKPICEQVVSLDPYDFWTDVLKTQGYLETLEEDYSEVPNGMGGVEICYQGSYRLLMEPDKEYILDI